MDKPLGFYPRFAGSTPARGTIYKGETMDVFIMLLILTANGVVWYITGYSKGKLDAEAMVLNHTKDIDSIPTNPIFSFSEYIKRPFRKSIEVDWDALKEATLDRYRPDTDREIH